MKQRIVVVDRSIGGVGDILSLDFVPTMGGTMIDIVPAPRIVDAGREPVLEPLYIPRIKRLKRRDWEQRRKGRRR